ncbi:MAG: hypothetical protein HIU90_08420 [Proteobacteria bacterium]|nr:hypothetical protein [Pseudomonadota bacterium]
MDDEEEQHRDGRLSAIARHQQHDQAVSRGMVAALRSMAARVESIERAVALQAGEIERIDRVLVEIMQQQRGAAGGVLDQAMQSVVEQVNADAG